LSRVKRGQKKSRRLHMLFWIATTGAALGVYSCGMQELGRAVFGANQVEPYVADLGRSDEADAAETGSEPASR
jgi:hypothetical protein